MILFIIISFPIKSFSIPIKNSDNNNNNNENTNKNNNYNNYSAPNDNYP